MQDSSFVLVPEQCSMMLRLLVESLFITHSQANLNMIGNVLNTDPARDHHPLRDPWLNRGHEWCSRVQRRRTQSSSS
jgi:hypothetical protein